jgi:glycosyltransferase involved in cell wall biosynthesis
MGSIEVIPASVVIPLYNEANTIADTIRSFKQQTVLPAELIVIDAGSNDDTLGIVKREWKNFIFFILIFPTFMILFIL